MNYILRVKWNSCEKFRQYLLSTEGMVMAEATSDDFWGVGVAPNLSQHTKPTKFLGQNHMGKLQMALRCHVAQPGVLNDNGEIALPLKPEYTLNSTANPGCSLSAIMESLTMSPVLIELKTVKSSLNTLDNFVNKESPSCERKLSGDTGSPSSIQNMKSSRTDGADSVS